MLTSNSVKVSQGDRYVCVKQIFLINVSSLISKAPIHQKKIVIHTLATNYEVVSQKVQRTITKTTKTKISYRVRNIYHLWNIQVGWNITLTSMT